LSQRSEDPAYRGLREFYKIVTRFYRENHFFFSPSLVGVLRKFCPNRNLTGRVARDELKLFAQSDNVARPLSEA
jgi:hypothetical protein